MDIYYLFISITFFIWVGRNILFWVGLWQDKEYRLDRLLVHFKETVQGKRLFLSLGNIIKLFLFVGYIYIVFHEQYTSFFEITVGLVFITQACIVIKDIIFHRIKRPVFTLKADALLLLSFLAVTVLFLSPLTNPFVWIVIVDRLLPAVIALFIFFFAFPTEIYRDIQIQRATKKMKQLHHVKVIAVSGSYGKTSTKEYIAQVLSKKFSVVNTSGSTNTPIGIAQTILKKVKPDTEIFVVEMGAYKKGELAQLCRIVKPHMSVTTAISDQHISLYGNFQNVVESEYEIIQALAKDGVALFNWNNEGTHYLYERTKKKKIPYQWFEKKPTKKIEIGAYNVHATPEGIAFQVILHNEEFNCSSPLLGIHAVENILPAIFFASQFGFSQKEIVSALHTLIPPPQTMMKQQLQSGMIGIDDTFNASPESVFAAMEYMVLHSTKKMFVLGPLTELGNQAKERHYQIGKKASTTCDYLFILNDNFSEDLLRGIADGKGTCQVHIGRPEDLATMIKKIGKKNDVVLFEGKESKMVMKKLL